MGHDARSELPSGVCKLFTWCKLDTLHTLQGSDELNVRVYLHSFFNVVINPLNAELNPICHLLALL